MSPVRCAIYTRKSSDEGLEQDFNSLHAQREACAAYVLSQASEGWQLVPDPYDDGGISGGTLERPALKRLLDDIAAGKVDIVVLYKIDRLTRSLLDFAKLVEAFDHAGTSFVSVTQSFNTTTSMGRLTLNMLLSFAQFEREVTAERIRDKVAASKAKGMWMGGIPPLGYKPHGRSLQIIEKHAVIVRDIYERYVRLGNVRRVFAELQAEGVQTPVRKTTTGRSFGGCTFSRGQIYAILKNQIYAGDIAHRGKVVPGQHQAIIERTLWDQVQAQLQGNLKGGRGVKVATGSPLAGLIYDGSGDSMLASHTVKGTQRYRYYVSKPLHLGGAVSAESKRAPAAEIEAAVAYELARLFDDPLALAERAHLLVEPATLLPLTKACEEFAAQVRERGPIGLTGLLVRVDVHATRLDLTVTTAALAERLGIKPHRLAPASFTLSSELRLTRTGRAIRLISDNGARLQRPDADPALINLVAKAHRWWMLLRKHDITPVELAHREGVSLSYITRVLRCAFLAPSVTEAILAGRQRPSVSATLLLRHDAIPIRWCDQEKLFIAC